MKNTSTTTSLPPTIKELKAEIHANAVEKGFWDKERNVGELFMLVITELAEALEAHRKGKMSNVPLFEAEGGLEAPQYLGGLQERFELHIKDTFEDELADTMIRILDLSTGLKIGLGVMETRRIGMADSMTPKNTGEQLLHITDMVVAAWKQHVKQNASHASAHLTMAVIRLIDVACGQHGIDLMRHITLKMQYNRTRSRMHGKSY